MAEKLNVGEIFIEDTNFKWRLNIDELRSVNEKGDRICSPKFTSSITGDDKILWHLSLYLKGQEESLDRCMGLFLHSNNDYDVTVTYSLVSVTNDRKIIRTIKFKNQTIESNDKFGCSYFLTEYFVLNPINDLIEDNQITFLCKFHDNSTEDQNSLFHQMNENILKNKNPSDVTIMAADGVEFLLHKNILRAQSSVFKAMFDCDMQEKKENLVKIDDFDSSVLSEFFNYLYTSKACFVKARDLLILAEKYNVEKLKDECELYMSLYVTVQLAVDYFKVADMYSAKKLRSNMIWFMGSNVKTVRYDPELQTLTADQLREILNRYIDLSLERREVQSQIA